MVIKSTYSNNRGDPMLEHGRRVKHCAVTSHGHHQMDLPRILITVESRPELKSFLPGRVLGDHFIILERCAFLQVLIDEDADGRECCKQVYGQLPGELVQLGIWFGNDQDVGDGWEL